MAQPLLCIRAPPKTHRLSFDCRAAEAARKGRSHAWGLTQKPVKTPKRACWKIILAMLSLSAFTASAQTLVWDASTSTANQQSGSGQWFGGTTWWDGNNNVAWDNSGSVIAQLGATTPSASLTPLVTPNTITITSSTVNVAGLNFMSLVSSPLTSGNQFAVAGASGGTLHFADNSVITVGDNSSTGSFFATLASTLLVTGNNLTMQKSNGTAQQFFRFDMVSNPGLTGSFVVKGDLGGIFVRAAAPGTFAAMSSISIESNSCYSLAGAGTYAVPLNIAGTGGAGQYGAIRVDTNNITISAPITMTADAGIQTNTGGVTNTVLSGGISGNFSFSRFATGSGVGTLSLASASTYTGSTTLGRAGTFTGGVTILDFTAATAPVTDILYSGVTNAGGLAFIGGNNSASVLNLTGKASTASSQRFGAVTVTGSSATIGGLAVINLTSGTAGSMDLSLGTISRSGTGMLAFSAPASGTISTTTANGFLGPWATFRNASGVTSWAQVSSGVVTGGYVGDLTHATGTAVSALPGYSATRNLTISSASTGNVTVTGTTTDIATLSLTDACNDRTIALGGNTLRLGANPSGGGIQLAAGASNLTISGGTLTGGGPTANASGQIILTNNSSASTLQIDATIANNGSGAMMLLFNGLSSSKTVLTGTNTYTGGTTIASGVVEMRSAGALGTSGTVTLLEGAALQLSGGITVSRALTVGGGGISNDGAIRNLSGNNTLSGIVTSNAPLRIQSDQGTLTLFNTNATTNSINPASTSNTLTFSGAGDIVVNSRINNTTQTIIKEGTGRLTLGGDNSVITSGPFTVNGGVLRVTNTAALGSTTGATTVTSGAGLELAFAVDSTLAEPITFDGSGFNGAGAIHNVAGNNTLSGTLSIGTTSLTSITADSGTTLTLSGILRSGATAAGTRTVSLGGAGTVNITGTVTNGTTPATYITALTKIDSGTANLRTAASYTGATIAKGGTLNLDFATSSTTSHLIVSNDALTLNGGTLQVTGKDSTTNTQGFISTTLTNGRSAIVVNSGAGGTANLALGTISRGTNSGSTVNITLPASGSITTTTINSNGILNGGMTVGGTTWATSAAAQSTGITWNNAADTVSIGNLANGSQVSFAGTAPGGLTAGTTYYVVNSTASTFQVAATDGGAVIPITNDGTTGLVNVAGAITGLSTYSSTFAANANVDVAGGTVTQGTLSVNSLRFNATGGTTLNLSGTLTNLTGGILISSAVTGDVTIQSDSATVRTLSSSTPNDFTVHQYGSGTFTIGSTVTLTNATAFTKTGPGTMTFAGTTATSGVQIRATQGTLNIVGDNRFTSTSDPGLTIGSATTSAKVSFGNNASTGGESLSTLAVLGTGASLVGSGSAIYTIGLQNSGTTDLRSLMIGGTGTNENNLAFEAYSGGTVQMGSGNTYAGRTNIGRATMEVTTIANAGTASSIGTGATAPIIDMNDTTSTSATVSTLRYLGTANAVTDRAVRLQTDGTTMPSLTAVIENNGTGTLKFTSAFLVAGNTTLPRLFRLSGTNTGVNEMVSIGNGPSSVVSLDKAGAGTWALTGNSTYTGGTTISAGTLQLGTGGTAGMVGTGDIAISSGAVLSTSRSDSFTIANNLTGAGSLAVNNAAGGVTILNSTGNIYSGGTSINTGTLMVTNTAGSATGSGSINVETVATLAGSGRLVLASGNSVSVCGTLSVGETSAAAADLEVTTSGTGTLLMDGGSVLLFDLTGGAGSGVLNGVSAADHLVVGGTLTINSGSTLRVQNLNGLSGWAVGDSWQIFDWTSLAGSSVGTFTTVDLPTLSGGFSWDISGLYTAGVISIAPEPGRTGLIAGALGALALRRRRTKA